MKALTLISNGVLLVRSKSAVRIGEGTRTLGAIELLNAYMY